MAIAHRFRIARDFELNRSAKTFSLVSGHCRFLYGVDRWLAWKILILIPLRQQQKASERDKFLRRGIYLYST
jgi:hypothetical protein